jgi:hypothetical protein
MLSGAPDHAHGSSGFPKLTRTHWALAEFVSASALLDRPSCTVRFTPLEADETAQVSLPSSPQSARIACKAATTSSRSWSVNLLLNGRLNVVSEISVAFGNALARI